MRCYRIDLTKLVIDISYLMITHRYCREFKPLEAGSGGSACIASFSSTSKNSLCFYYKKKSLPINHMSPVLF
jgi:hypothetical protein